MAGLKLLLVALIVLGLIGFVMLCKPANSNSSEGYDHSKGGSALQESDSDPLAKQYKPGFLPSHQGPWFQNLSPSLRVENRYHQCILENGGDYGNYELRQKCYIKTLKDGTNDKADLLCWRYRNDEDQYYNCLDYIYGGGNNWMDRGTSIGFCRCEDGSKGVLEQSGACFCPEYRPLNDRRMVDENDDIVDRL